MKFFLFFLGFFFAFPKLYGQNLDEIIVSESYSGLELNEILRDIESKYPVLFSLIRTGCQGTNNRLNSKAFLYRLF